MNKTRQTQVTTTCSMWLRLSWLQDAVFKPNIRNSFRVLFLIALTYLWSYSLFGIHKVTVGPNQNYDYTNLNSALMSLRSYTGPETEAIVKLADDTYVNSNPYIINFSLFTFTSLTIESENGPEDCILQGDSSTPVNFYGKIFHVIGHSNKNFTIRNLAITSVSVGSTIYGLSAYYQTDPLQSLNVTGCNFECKNYAIQINNSATIYQSSIVIEENVFTDVTPANEIQYFGGVDITSNNDTYIMVRNNNFEHTRYPLYVQGRCYEAEISNNVFSTPYPATNPASFDTSHKIQIDDGNGIIDSSLLFKDNLLINTCISLNRMIANIQDNTFWATAPFIGFSGFINCLNDDNEGITPVTIRGNTIYGQTDTGSIIAEKSGNTTAGAVDLKIVNNSILNASKGIRIDFQDQVVENSVSEFSNNLLDCTNEPIYIYNPEAGTPTTTVAINSSWFVNGYPTGNNFIVDNTTCGTGDPLIQLDATNNAYSLIWDETTRSPLIMNGYYLFGGMRFDRPDIGAIQYSESPHEYITYKFPPYSQRNGLKWMSFPSLDRIWNPAINEPDVANTFFNPIMNTMILDKITRKVQNNEVQEILHNGQNWEGELSHIIIPEQGYKIQMAQGLQNEQSIAVPGIIPNVSATLITLKAFPSSKAPRPDNENWLGYFHTATVDARVAFGNILGRLWSIQTQNWTMVRENMVEGSPWIIAYQYGKEPTLSYGDMVIVKCFEDAQFYWNTDASNQTPTEKELPSHFVFEEKPDYVPFYVELDSSDLPTELALFVDDVCKGATVVCDSLAEIPGYIVGNANPDAVVEIRAYYEDKAAVDKIPAFVVWNSSSGAYEDKPLVLNRQNYYYKVKLAQGEGETPAATVAAMEIYPNPFNPSTTIRFSLPEATQIKLEVYNLKGQLVRTLAQGIADSGKQSVSWDGTDNQNRRVGSGLYYSKLSYQDKSIIQKMVMMK